MGILKRIRQGLARRAGAAGQRGERQDIGRFGLAAELPLGGGAAPLWRVDVQVQAEPHADGERVRVRAHFQTNFASVLRPSLDAPRAALPGAVAPSLAERAGALVQRSAARALDLPLLRTLVQPLLQHDFNTWIEVQASSASLDGGAHELLPQGEKLQALGIRPRRADGPQPMAESWSGTSPHGFAQVSMLQLDKRHLPPELARALGDKPFHLAAAIVNTVEEK